VAPPINYECPSCEGHLRTWTALAEVGLVQVAVNWFGHYIVEDSSQAVTLASWGTIFARAGSSTPTTSAPTSSPTPTVATLFFAGLGVTIR